MSRGTEKSKRLVGGRDEENSDEEKGRVTKRDVQKRKQEKRTQEMNRDRTMNCKSEVKTRKAITANTADG